MQGVAWAARSALSHFPWMLSALHPSGLLWARAGTLAAQLAVERGYSIQLEIDEAARLNFNRIAGTDLDHEGAWSNQRRQIGVVELVQDVEIEHIERLNLAAHASHKQETDGVRTKDKSLASGQRKTNEKTARQLGGLFFSRENSSNGGSN